MDYYGTTLYRVRAIRDFSDVKAGDFGGFIEHDGNLSQEGDCWVYGDAIIANNSTVSDNAKIYGDSIVEWSNISGNAKIFDSRIENAYISGNSRIYKSFISEFYVQDNAVVYNSNPGYGTNEYGYGEIKGDEAFLTDGNGNVVHIKDLAKPNDLLAEFIDIMSGIMDNYAAS